MTIISLISFLLYHLFFFVYIITIIAIMTLLFTLFFPQTIIAINFIDNYYITYWFFKILYQLILL